MIKKCNFKIDNQFYHHEGSDIHPEGEVMYEKGKFKCSLIPIVRERCPGEENCILFQIYKNIPHMMTKKEMENVIPERGGDIKCTCIKCGEISHHDYSSGYCNECYDEECHPPPKEKQSKRLKKWAEDVAERSKRIW